MSNIGSFNNGYAGAAHVNVMIYHRIIIRSHNPRLNCNYMMKPRHINYLHKRLRKYRSSNLIHHSITTHHLPPCSRAHRPFQAGGRRLKNTFCDYDSRQLMLIYPGLLHQRQRHLRLPCEWIVRQVWPYISTTTKVSMPIQH